MQVGLPFRRRIQVQATVRPVDVETRGLRQDLGQRLAVQSLAYRADLHQDRVSRSALVAGNARCAVAEQHLENSSRSRRRIDRSDEYRSGGRETGQAQTDGVGHVGSVPCGVLDDLTRAPLRPHARTHARRSNPAAPRLLSDFFTHARRSNPPQQRGSLARPFLVIFLFFRWLLFIFPMTSPTR